MKKYKLDPDKGVVEDDYGDFVRTVNHFNIVRELMAKVEALTPKDGRIHVNTKGELLWSDPKQGEMQARLGAVAHWLYTKCNCPQSVQAEAFAIIDGPHGPGVKEMP